MQGYVIDKSGKVVESRANITKGQLADGSSFVIAFDKDAKPGETKGEEWPAGSEIPKGKILSRQQLAGVLSATRAHVLNAFLHAR